MKEFSPEWFDSCSRAWLANKKRDGHSYKYKCGVEDCGNRVKGTGSTGCGNCSAHAGAGIVLVTPRMVTRSMVSNRPLLRRREQNP